METPPPVCGCMGWWVDRWVGSCQITTSGINLDLIKIIQVCLFMKSVETPPPMDGWGDVKSLIIE